MTFKASLLAALAVATVASSTGVAAGQTRFTLFAADGSQIDTKDVEGLAADFTGLTTQPVTASAQILDTAGALLFDPVTCTLTDGDAPASGDTGTVQVTPLASLSGTFSTES